MDKKVKLNSVRFKINVLPILILLIFILIIGIATTQIIKNKMIAEMKEEGFNLANHIAHQIENTTMAMDVINATVENKIKETANLVIQNSGNLNNDFLIKLAKALNVDEINVADKNGKIIYSNLKENIGYVYDETHIAQKLLKGETKELMEEIRKSTVSENYYKYGYVKTPDGGFIQVGILANNIQKLMEHVDYQKLVENIASNKGIVYALILDKQAKAIAHSNKERIGKVFDDEGSRTAAIEGKPYFSTYYYEAAKQTVYDVLVPLFVNGEHIGAVDVGLSMESVNNSIKSAVTLILVLFLIGLLVVGAVLYSNSASIVKTLNFAKNHIEKLAEGDFTASIPGKYLNIKDEVGMIISAINNLQESFKSIASSIKKSSDTLFSNAESLSAASQEIAASSSEVAKTIQEIANGATNQASDIEEITGLIRNITGNLDKVYEKLRKVKDNSDNTEKVADIGKKEIDNLIEIIRNIRTSFESVEKNIETLTVSMGQIGEITEIINGIAEQTNLLALNAAIEAARAGEVGRGFAVVASEIRKLAEESKNSSNRIKDLLTGIEKETNDVVVTSKSVTEMLKNQIVSVENTIKSFDDILSAVKAMAPLIKDTFEALDDTVKSKDLVVSRTDSIKEVIEETAASAEEISASAEELSASTEEIAATAQGLTNVAKELSDNINKFKI